MTLLETAGSLLFFQTRCEDMRKFKSNLDTFIRNSGNLNFLNPYLIISILDIPFWVFVSYTLHKLKAKSINSHYFL